MTRHHRDWIIDVARVGSVVVVVLMHWIWQRVTVVGGQVRLANSLNGDVMVALTWLLMVMPLFFLAGGFANTLIVDRCRERGEGYGQFLGLRARRLFTPLLPLLAVFAVLGLLTPRISASAARTAAREPANVLWFLGVYAICTALAPLQVWLHDRVSWWAAPTVWFALAAGIDSLHLHGRVDGTFNMLAVWPACHALGIVYARRRLHRVPTPALLAVAAVVATGIYATVRMGWFAPQNIGLAGRDQQNLMPPTTVLALLGVIQLCVLVPVSRRLDGWVPRPGTRRLISAANALLMHIYLWHVPVLVLLVGVGMAAPALLLPADPAVWWLTRLVWVPLAAGLLWGIVLLATRWDLFMARYPARGGPVVTVVATVIACVATYVLWKGGLSARPTSLLAGAGIALAVAMLTRWRATGAPAPEETEPAPG